MGFDCVKRLSPRRLEMDIEKIRSVLGDNVANEAKKAKPRLERLTKTTGTIVVEPAAESVSYDNRLDVYVRKFEKPQKDKSLDKVVQICKNISAKYSSEMVFANNKHIGESLINAVKRLVKK